MCVSYTDWPRGRDVASAKGKKSTHRVSRRKDGRQGKTRNTRRRTNFVGKHREISFTFRTRLPLFFLLIASRARPTLAFSDLPVVLFG